MEVYVTINMHIYYDMNCYSSYLVKDGIKRQKFNINPKILPNGSVLVFIDDQNSSSCSISKYFKILNTISIVIYLYIISRYNLMSRCISCYNILWQHY